MLCYLPDRRTGKANAVAVLIFAQAFYWACRGIALIIKALKQ